MRSRRKKMLGFKIGAMRGITLIALLFCLIGGVNGQTVVECVDVKSYKVGCQGCPDEYPKEGLFGVNVIRGVDTNFVALPYRSISWDSLNLFFTGINDETEIIIMDSTSYGSTDSIYRIIDGCQNTLLNEGAVLEIPNTYVNADTNLIEHIDETDTIDAVYVKLVQQDGIVVGQGGGGGGTDDQILTKLELTEDTLTVGIENGNELSVELDGLGADLVERHSNVSVDSVVVSISLPVDKDKYEVWVNDNVKLVEVNSEALVDHWGKFWRSGQVLKFYKNLENEEIFIRVMP